MQTLTTSVFRFDDFELDVTRRRLLRGGELVVLNPKTFDLLVTLVEHHGEVLSRDQLLESVWPGQFVEEGNLTVQVSALRKIFGEDKTEHRYVVTVPGRGYSFVANVVRAAEPGGAPPAEALLESDNPPKPDTRRRATIYVVLITLAIASLASVLIYRYVSNKDSTAFGVESIAVMPFVNESGSADLEYLSDGMTETLITSLARLPKLTVKARNSVFRYKGREVDPRTAGNELSVQAILFGRLNDRDGQVNLRLELVDARTENVLWSQTYQREGDSLAGLQNVIARDVSEVLRLRLSDSDQLALARNQTSNSEAYRLYLKGIYQLNKFSRDGSERAISYFQQALELDPNYARAYAGVAYTYGWAGDLYLSGREASAKARPAAMRALALDDSLAEVHTSLGVLDTYYGRNWPAAERSLLRAIEIDPNYAPAHRFLAAYHAQVAGKKVDAIRESKIAVELDSLSLDINTSYGEVLIYVGEYDAATQQLRKTLELDESYWFTHYLLGLALERKGSLTDALAEYQRAAELEPNNPLVDSMIGRLYGTSGRADDARSYLVKLTELSRSGYVAPHFIAGIYASLDERDRALAWLEKCEEDGSAGLLYVRVDPFWDRFRSEPRFKALMQDLQHAP